MNMWITAEPTTSPSAAHAIRQRLMNPPIAKRVTQVPEVEPLQIVFGYRCKNPKDAHVRAWQWHVAQEGCKVQKHIRQRARELGVSVEDINAHRHFRRFVEARQIIMYELRETFGLSYPEIGRRIGGRDNTTVIHAHRKIAAQIANTQYQVKKKITLPPGQLEIVRLRSQGYTNKEVEALLGITKSIRKGRMQRAMESTGAGSMIGLIGMAKREGWLR